MDHDDVQELEDDVHRERLSRLLAQEDGFAWGRCFASVLVMILIALGTVAGGLYWRLGKGPLQLPFLERLVRSHIAESLPAGYGFDLADVRLARRDHGLAIILDDLSIHDAAGTRLASTPHLDIGFEALPLLWAQVAIRSVVVDGATASASIAEDGRVSFRTGGDGEAGPAMPTDLSVSSMLGGLDAILVAAGSMDTIEFRNASLVVHDKPLDRDTTYGPMKLMLRRTSAVGGLSVTLDAGGGILTATIEGRPDGARLIDMQARSVSAASIVMGLSPGAPPPELTARFDALGRARIDADGRITQASLSLNSKGGSWRIEPDVKPFAFDQVGIDLHWDAAASQILVDSLLLRAGEGGGNFSGRIVPPTGHDNAVWQIELDSPDTLLAGASAAEPPLKLTTASIRGRYEPAIRRLGIDRAEFAGPTGGVAIAGSVTFGQRAPGIGMGLAGTRMPVTALKRFWPFFAAPKAREWFLENVRGGMVEAATLSLAIPVDALATVNGKVPPLESETIRGDVVFSDGTVNVVDTLPPVSKAAAHGTFTAQAFNLEVSDGMVDLGDAGAITLSGTYEIPDFRPTPSTQRARFHASGAAAAVAKMLTLPPLSTATNGVPIDPAKVAGQAEFDVSLELPLVDHPAAKDIRYTLSGMLDNAAIKDFEGMDLRDGDLKFAVETDVLLLTGKAVVAGIPARIDFRKARDAPPQVAIGLTIDDAVRQKQGIDFGDAIDGPFTAEVRVTGGRYDVDVDLTPTRIRDLLPGWQKPPGRPGKASFVWEKTPGGSVLHNFVLSSGPVDLRGEIALGPDNKFRKATLSSLKLSPDDNASGSIEASDQAFKATIRGKAFDVRPTIKLLQQRGGPGTASGTVTADIALDEVQGFGDETASNLQVTLDAKGSLIRRISAQADLSGGTVAIRQDGSGNVLIDTADAGSLLRFFDYYSHVQKGELRVAMTPKLSAMAGQVAMRDFSVVNEPALGRYRSTLQAGEAGSGANASASAGAAAAGSGDTARFSRLKIGFQRTTDRLVITEGVVWGTDVGVSLSGDINYAADKVNMTGTFVPAYALNNLFGQIPLLGEILGGGKNGGLFAINFKVSGSMSAPVLTFNPLSAIAPGFLRKLFEFQKEGQ